MKFKFTDFCAFGRSDKEREWRQMCTVLRNLDTYVKASRQAEKVGSLIFDPVATNEAIKSALRELGWGTNIPIPEPHSALGTDVDYGVNGVLAEGQFSNYPFLINNLFRTGFFREKQVAFRHIGHVHACVIVTKVRDLPASNSTLYYEQALKQMRLMLDAKALAIPTRLVGLAVDIDEPFEATLTTYGAGQRSRTVHSQATVRCRLQRGSRPDSRCLIVRL